MGVSNGQGPAAFNPKLLNPAPAGPTRALHPKLQKLDRVRLARTRRSTADKINSHYQTGSNPKNPLVPAPHPESQRYPFSDLNPRLLFDGQRCLQRFGDRRTQLLAVPGG